MSVLKRSSKLKPKTLMLLAKTSMRMKKTAPTKAPIG